MELRKLTNIDLDACWQCRLRALEFAPTAFGTTLSECIANGSGRLQRIFSGDGINEVVFGAVLENKIVGMLIVSRENGLKSRHKASITSMYVDLDQRKKGIATQLLDLAIEHAKNRMGAIAIFLSVEASNSSAQKLYSSRGFKCWGREPFALLSEGVFFEEDHLILKLS